MVFLNKKSIAKLLLSFTALFVFMGLFANETKNNDDKPEKFNIQVNFLNRYPFSFKDVEGKIKGIEIEILESFATWARKNHNLDVQFEYVAHNTFNDVYQSIKQATGNVVGAGTITIKKERFNDFNLSAPYLRNVSVLISNGARPTLSSLDLFDTVFNDGKAVSTENSVHLSHLKSIKRGFYPDMTIELVKNQEDVPALIQNNPEYYGYVDLFQFWKYRQNNPESFLKVHRIADRNEEHFGFAFPKDALRLESLFNDFFNDGFGFTATKNYHSILEQYLGKELIPTVEINFAGY